MKKAIIIFLILIMLSVCTLSNAAVVITEDKLEEAFNKYAEGSSDYSLDKENNKIFIKDEEITYELKYDLEDKPRFYTDLTFNKSMTKEETDLEIEKSILPMIGFILTSDIMGVKTEDSLVYFFHKYIAQIKNMDLNETIEYTDGIDYAKKIYPKNQIFADNFFTLTINKQEESDTEYKLRAELAVNTEEDFSILNGYAEANKEEIGKQLGEILGFDFEGVLDAAKDAQDKLNQAIEEEKNLLNEQKNNVANISKIPNTGEEISISNILISIIAVSTIIAISLFIYNRKKNA